jgi:hypothetical protein
VLNVVTALPIALVRGPYLQAGSPTGGVVRWRTDQFSDAVVHYGTDLIYLTNIAMQSVLTNNHVVSIGGLQPSTKYFYEIGSSSQSLVGGTNVNGSNYWFVTAPAAGGVTPFRFWALGDSGTGNANAAAVREAYYNFAATNKPADIWIMLGDNAYNSGLDTEYQTAVFNFYPTTLRNLFLWPVLGNHESNQSTDQSIHYPYLDIFSTPQNGEAGGLPTGSPKYYSFDYANVHFVGLDSMTSGRTTNDVMLQWLQNDLMATTQKWKIVFFHHPPYTKGSHDSDAESDLVQIRQTFNPILEANGVDLVMGGHSHVHERSYLLHGHYGLSATINATNKIDAGNGRMDGTGAYVQNEKSEGTVYSVTGSSGQIGGGQLNHPAHLVSINELGSFIVDVNGDRLDAQFLNGTGGISDHFTLIKRQPEPPAEPGALIVRASTNSIELMWVDYATNEFGYRIYRSIDGNNFTLLGTNGANSTNYIDITVLPGVLYYYDVRAYNAAGNSDGSKANAFTGNNKPRLDEIPNAITEVLRTLRFTATASDIDVPANHLTYSLDPGPFTPPTATINASNGIFRWQTTRADAGKTNYLIGRVTDDGVPPLTDTWEFQIIVRDYVELSVGSVITRAGQTTNVPINVVCSAPLSNLTFAISLPSDRLTTLSLQNLVPAIANATLDASTPNVALLTFTALPGQSLSGTQQLARLNFTAAPGQTSTFIPLELGNVSGQRAQPGLAPTLLLNNGRVVMVDGQPLLEAARSYLDGARWLTIYGRSGSNYMIETSTNPANPAAWQSWRVVGVTNLVGTTTADAGTNGAIIFYRAR